MTDNVHLLSEDQRDACELRPFARLKPRRTVDIEASPISVGFETLDRYHFAPERTYPHLAQACFREGMGKWIDKLSWHPYRAIPEHAFEHEVRTLRRLIADFAPTIGLWHGRQTPWETPVLIDPLNQTIDRLPPGKCTEEGGSFELPLLDMPLLLTDEAMLKKEGLL